MDCEGDVELIGGMLRALADPVRLRLLAAVLEEPRTLEELAALLRTDIATVARHLRKLERAGAVTAITDSMTRYRGDLTRLKQAAIQMGTPKRAAATATGGAVGGDAREVLRAFFDGQRLISLPVQQRKKEIVLEELLRRIPARQNYRESELNQMIETMFDDYCTVRREWIIRRYMVRDHGVYRLAERGLAIVAT